VRPRAFRLLVAAASCLAAAACGRAPSPEQRAVGRLGEVGLWRPAGSPSALVYLFSDDGGWSPAWDGAANSLRARGAAVVGVDLRRAVAGLDASDEGCHEVVSELAEWSQEWQRALGADVYRSPILAGAGAGATFARAALAQAPAATIAGAVVADPVPALATRAPLCPAEAAHPAPEGGFTYDAPSSPAGFVREARAGSEPAAERLAGAVADAIGEAGVPEEGVGALPLAELPSAGPGDVLAVIYSGDGGWRDLDKTVGEHLARAGVAVVGVDSLRYFWREKTPERVGSDLAAILQHYAAKWRRARFVLIGYSFGADVLSLAYNRLPEAERAQVIQVTLLAPGMRSPLGFRVAGWLQAVGIGPDPYRDAPEVLPELRRIDPRLVQCVFGQEERDTPCRAPELAEAERLETRGAHHFDGDYAALARRILDGIARRTQHAGVAP